MALEFKSVSHERYIYFLVPEKLYYSGKKRAMSHLNNMSDRSSKTMQKLLQATLQADLEHLKPVLSQYLGFKIK